MNNHRAFWTFILITLIGTLSSCGNRDAERQAAKQAASQAADRKQIRDKIELYEIKFQIPQNPTNAFNDVKKEILLELSTIAQRLPADDRTRKLAEAFDETTSQFCIRYEAAHQQFDWMKKSKIENAEYQNSASKRLEQDLADYRLRMRGIVEALRADSK